MDYIQDRQLKIRLLKVASRRVKDGYCICNALSCAIPMVRRLDTNVLEIYEAVAELKKYIMKALGPSTYYHDWIMNYHRELWRATPTFNFRLGRLAWINWMIACYEEDIANYKETNG